MKVIEKETTIESSGVTTTAKFGIKKRVLDTSSTSCVTVIVDAATAVIREYATNAADAHVEAGISERPIEVTLPSRLNLQFKIRDYGKS